MRKDREGSSEAAREWASRREYHFHEIVNSSCSKTSKFPTLFESSTTCGRGEIRVTDGQDQGRGSGMNGGKTRRFVIIICLSSVLSLTLGACAPEAETSRGSPRARRVRYTPNYDEKSCAISKHDGGEAKLPLASLVVRSEFFGKKFDQALLDGVLKASAVATGRYVSEVLGGRLFRIPYDWEPSQSVCPMFTELPVAPDEYRDLWDKYARVDLGWKLAGLYFEDCARSGFSCSDHGVVRPTILIDESRDRWTLVHEMMHFNFNRERKRDPGGPSETALAEGAYAAKEAVQSAFASYRARRDRSTLTLMQEQNSWLIRNWFHQTMIRSFLEEVAVEGTLLDEFLADRLQNVSATSAGYALQYMTKSISSMRSEYESAVFELDGGVKHSLESLRAFVATEASRRGWTDLEQRASADLDFFRYWESQGQKQIAERKERLSRRQAVPSDVQRAAALLFEAPVDEAHRDHVHGLPGWSDYRAWKIH